MRSYLHSVVRDLFQLDIANARCSRGSKALGQRIFETLEIRTLLSGVSVVKDIVPGN